MAERSQRNSKPRTAPSTNKVTKNTPREEKLYKPLVEKRRNSELFVIRQHSNKTSKTDNALFRDSKNNMDTNKLQAKSKFRKVKNPPTFEHHYNSQGETDDDRSTSCITNDTYIIEREQTQKNEKKEAKIGQTDKSKMDKQKHEPHKPNTRTHGKRNTKPFISTVRTSCVQSTKYDFSKIGYNSTNMKSTRLPRLQTDTQTIMMPIEIKTPESHDKRGTKKNFKTDSKRNNNQCIKKNGGELNRPNKNVTIVQKEKSNESAQLIYVKSYTLLKNESLTSLDASHSNKSTHSIESNNTTNFCFLNSDITSCCRSNNTENDKEANNCSQTDQTNSDNTDSEDVQKHKTNNTSDKQRNGPSLTDSKDSLKDKKGSVAITAPEDEQKTSQNCMNKSANAKKQSRACKAELGGYTIKFGLKSNKVDKPKNKSAELDDMIDDDDEKKGIKDSAYNFKLCGLKSCKNMLNRKSKNGKRKSDSKAKDGQEDKEKSKEDDKVAIDINLPIGQIYKINAPNLFSVIINHDPQDIEKGKKRKLSNHKSYTSVSNKKEKELSDTDKMSAEEVFGKKNRFHINVPTHSRAKERQFRDRQIQMYNKFLKSLMKDDDDEQEEKVYTKTDTNNETDEESVHDRSITSIYSDDDREDSEVFIKPHFLDPDKLFNDESLIFNKNQYYKCGQDERKPLKHSDIRYEIGSKKYGPWGSMDSTARKNEQSESHNEERNVKNKKNCKKMEDKYESIISIDVDPNQSNNNIFHRGQLYHGKKSLNKRNSLFQCKKKHKNSGYEEIKEKTERKKHRKHNKKTKPVKAEDTTAETEKSSKDSETNELLFCTSNKNILSNLVTNEARENKSKTVIVFSQLSYKPSHDDMCYKGLRYHETKISETKRVSVSKKNGKVSLVGWIKNKLFPLHHG